MEQTDRDGIVAALAAEAEVAAENAARESQIAAAQAASHIITTPKQSLGSGHPNDGTVEIDADAQILTVDLQAVRMVKGSTGTVSGYCRILVGGKAIGAVTLYSPTDLMAKEDKAQSAEAKRLMDMQGAALRRGDVEAAVNYLNMADAAQKRFDAAKSAAKLDWEGRSGQDVVRHRQTL